MEIQKYLVWALTLFSLINVLLAAPTAKNVSVALGQTCGTIKGALAIGMLLLVVLAAIVYAVGQVMGAETRARASVWATAMFTGAIVAALIYILVPFIIELLLTGQLKTNSKWFANCCKDGLKESELIACANELKI